VSIPVRSSKKGEGEFLTGELVWCRIDIGDGLSVYTGKIQQLVDDGRGIRKATYVVELDTNGKRYHVSCDVVSRL